ncbi:hypothetical protein Lesp02_83330 [Lentzea sp. NBRC 105346]|uniref:cytochrome P450 n=1 Tax=Lentzea sp. NBRC 105346 TaxID=3032205 RepID=UPI0024A4062C|nr:cytochrome P450 [Lentzea sp. NBRC 105346]GLZ36146.1 hypothetical protein Lesp02_83330 [Lentzea sp. NBRC 105346]
MRFSTGPDDPRFDEVDDDFRAVIDALGPLVAASRATRRRVFHRNATGARGTLKVLDSPDLPAHSFFQPGREFDVIARYSNSIENDDIAPAIRGITLRFGGLDLSLNTGDRFFARSADVFHRYFAGQGAALVAEDPSFRDTAWNLYRHATSYAEYHYHSQVPSGFTALDGTQWLIRYRLVPADGTGNAGLVDPGDRFLPPEPPGELTRFDPEDPRSRVFLHEELRSRLSRSSVDAVLQVQLHPAEESGLDCTVTWDLPWRDVATVSLTEMLANDEIEELRFNHANTPPDLGLVLASSPYEPASLNHLRALVYRLTAAARLGEEPSTARTVVVIGAGPAGLSVARELEKAGHRAIVLEKLPAVGGKCESIDIDDRAYDLGGHVCTTQYENVARLAQELGVPTEDTTPHRIYDLETGESRPQSTEFFQRETFGRYQELREQEFPLIATAGLAHSARALAEPVTSWLARHGLESMAGSLGTGYTAAGYGYLQGDLPALYFVKYAEMTGLLSAKPSLLGHPGSFTIVGGFKGLWEKVAAGLSDVRCGVTITSITRSPDVERGGVRVSTVEGDVVADDIVLTVPISELLDVLDASEEERDLAGRVRSMDYYTTVVSVTGLPESAFYLLDEEPPGNAVSFHHRYPDSDVYAVYSYGAPDLDGDDVIACFRSTVERLGGTLGEVHTQRRWKFLPYFGGDDIRDGVYDRIERLQGNNHTFHAGSLPAYELVECNVAYSKQLVREHFGGAEEDDVFGHSAVVIEEAPTVAALRSWLVSHIAEELRVDTVSSSARLDSFALESMSVAALQSGLSDWLGYRIPHTLFLEHPTIDAVAEHLAVEESVEQKPAASDSSLLLGLTSARPFFCVGGALGAAYYLLKLARDVGSSRPFYGLRAPGYDGTEEPLDTVEALAARYVQEIRVIQPYGPYLLGGHSFGGVVAYEMGRQLRLAGEEVTRIVLLDSYVPIAGQDLPPVDDAAAIEELLTMNRLAFSSGGPAGVEIDPSLAISEQKERLGRFLGSNGSLPVDEHIGHMLRVYQANLEANVKYQPLPSDLDVTLLKAADGFPPVMQPHRNTALHLDCPANGWANVTVGSLSVVDIPGDHFTMFVEPNDMLVADAVHSCMLHERRAANTMAAQAIMFNPDDPAFLNDPYPFYRALRETAPMHYEDTLGGLVLTRYDDVSALLRDHRVIRPPVTDYLFASVPQAQRDEMIAFERQLAGSLPFTNAPYHTRLRGLIAKAFTPRKIRAMRDRVGEITDSLLDVLDVCDGGDLMSIVAYPLPSTVVMEFIGVPERDHERMTFLGTEMMALLGAQYAKDAPAIARRAHAAMNEFTEYLTGLIGQRRANPREDLLSTLISGELTDDEVINNCMALINAGLETTANYLGNGTLALLRHPEQFALLGNDPLLAESAAEELLRYDGPTPILTPQLANEDLELGGMHIKKGTMLYPVVGAANHDPARFPDPDRLDITRQPNGQLSFGFGIHFCIGAALARIEGQEFFTRLATRFPHLRLDPDAPAPVFRDDPLLRGLEHLHVRTTRP